MMFDVWLICYWKNMDLKRIFHGFDENVFQLQRILLDLMIVLNMYYFSGKYV